MNCLWILLFLFCCGGNNRCEEEQCDRNDRRDRGDFRRADDRYPRAPFSPDCDRERERERECGCRASEMEQETCKE